MLLHENFFLSDYLEASDSMLMGIMMRFRTLSATNQTLVQMLSDQSDGVGWFTVYAMTDLNHLNLL